MNRFAYYMSGYAFRAFSGISKARITIHGKEKIPEGSLIFTANHFTRIETVFLPYHIHELTKKPVWSLAAAELFQGGLKGILEAMGAVSTRDPQRDFLIVKSLLAGTAECIIFPEGMMVKNKKITRDGEFRLYQDGEVQRPHTGAAILALTTEFYRERLRRMKTINPVEFKRLIDQYELSFPEKILEQQTFIVPVNITYYPVRAKENVLSRLALTMMENPSQRVMDELLTEGTMLFSGVDVDIRIGESIAIKDYFFNSFVESDVTSRRRVDFSNRLSSHHVMKAAAQDIMNRYMKSVYEMTTLNYDHIFASILKYYVGNDGIDEYDFRCRAYLATFSCSMSLYCNFHRSLYENQIHILTNDRFHRYEDFLSLALETGIVEMRENRLFKDNTRFDSPSAFHTVRVDNPVSVIANEVEPLSRLQAHLADIAAKTPSEIAQLMLYRIEDKQYNQYINDFNNFACPVNLLDKNIEAVWSANSSSGNTTSGKCKDKDLFIDNMADKKGCDEKGQNELSETSGNTRHGKIEVKENIHHGKIETKENTYRGKIETKADEVGDNNLDGRLQDGRLQDGRLQDGRLQDGRLQDGRLHDKSDNNRIDHGNRSKIESANKNALLVINSSNEKVEIDNENHISFINRYPTARSRMAVYNNGRPRLLKSDSGDTGVLLIHDYLSTPGELVSFAAYLQKNGYTVYMPRLPGHGTSPANLLETTFEQWIESVEEGLVLLRTLCRKKIVGGLGVGALTGFALQSRVKDIDGFFMVSPPSRIKDYSSGFLVPGGLWQQMIKRARHPSAGKDMFIEYAIEGSESDSVGFRYTSHPASGLRQVEMLMNMIEAGVKEKHDKQGEQKQIRLDVPVLVIQSRKNPFVDPDGTKKLFDMMPASVKEYYLFDFDRHTILTGKGSQRVYGAVSEFIASIL
ncbi:putative Carboxylesterase [Desulfamplus magnetovallimortis]|uniref:Putative Carboxylesterase n=1 Tax=Desulfamplus magnetovallimortis TaxID=1246637 RepID=A0A1W1H5T3_9BACT|nr:alpha/beta hydrolase [Desulfamplus magnetovallimortis]SLM27728.1 putative Carboxylesterase [Desulfamplus magnetovallimortis]